jgi:hypothetical protein
MVKWNKLVRTGTKILLQLVVSVVVFLLVVGLFIISTQYIQVDRNIASSGLFDREIIDLRLYDRVSEGTPSVFGYTEYVKTTDKSVRLVVYCTDHYKDNRVIEVRKEVK